MTKAALPLLFILGITGCATGPKDPLEAERERQALIEECRKLKKQQDTLKGKPVRRNAAMEEYRATCGPEALRRQSGQNWQ